MRDFSVQVNRTVWSKYAETVLYTDKVYKEIFSVFNETYDNVYVGEYSPEVMKSFVSGEPYVVVMLQDRWLDQFWPLMEAADILVFFTQVQRMQFMREYPKTLKLPVTVVLPEAKPSVGYQSLHRKNIGILAPDDGNLQHLISLRHGIIAMARNNKLPPDYSFVFYLYNDDQYSSLINSSWKTDPDKEPITFVNLNDPSTCKDLAAFPSLVMTFDTISSSPFVASLRKLGVPVSYVGISAHIKCEAIDPSLTPSPYTAVMAEVEKLIDLWMSPTNIKYKDMMLGY